MDTANSIASESQDVDKSFLDAEHFLSNFTSLRDECERLKAVNQQLEAKVQQLSQKLQQSQVEKTNLEMHIQKETLHHKQVVWTLKTEVQKSQEERLSWKEKYLDLCIKSSHHIVKDLHSKVSDKTQAKSKEAKKLSKKLKRKQTRKKIKPEYAEKTDWINIEQQQEEQQQHQQETIRQEMNQQIEHQSQPMEQDHTQQQQQQQQPDQQLQQLPPDQQLQQDQMQQQKQEEDQEQQPPLDKLINTTDSDVKFPIDPASSSTLDADKVVDQPVTSNDNSDVSQVEPLNLVTMQHGVDTMKTVSIVDSLDGTSNLNVSTVTNCSQNHVVNTNAQTYYNLQSGAFDLNNQAQTDNTTTFILQTPDATFCATAVIENSPRDQYTNSTDPSFVIKQDGFDGGHNTFPTASGQSDDSSDENTEFNYRCSLCNYTFSDEDMLARHMKARHTAKTYICKECGKAYSTKGSLAQHTHHYHRHPNAYACDVCKKTFNRKDFLIKHLKTHTEDREFQCKHCDKSFKTNASLSAHVNGSHNDTRRFVCDYCGMRTSWRLSYLEHMKLHTGEPRNSARRKKSTATTVQQQEQQQQQQQQQQQLSQLVNDNGTVVQFITTAEG